MNRQINIKVENLIPTLLNDTEIVCGNSGYTIKFTFDEEWSKYNVKTALFVCGGVTYDSVFEGDTCKVPIIEKGASCYIGVVSGNVKDTSLPPDKVTTTWAIVNVKEGITSISQEPQAPTPDIYVEFMALLNKYIQGGGGGTGGGSGEGTKVTVNGNFVETFDADTKLDKGSLSWSGKTLENSSNEEDDMGDDIQNKAIISPKRVGASRYSSSGYEEMSITPEGVEMTSPSGEVTKVKFPNHTSGEQYGTVELARNQLAGQGTTDNAGLVYTPNGSWNGINSNNGVLTLMPASNSQIDGKTNQYNAIVPKNLDYAVRSVVGEDIAEHERRLEDLESVLLTYQEDKTQAYEKVVPNAVAPNAILDSIGGESIASKNLYNPKGDFSVNADGSIRISEQANYSGPTTVVIPSITLNAGTYYIKYNAVGNATIDTFFLSDDNGDNLNPSTLIVDKTTTYYARVDFDATSSETGGCEVDLYVMISKTDIPFEPYFEGLHHASVTKVISKDKQGNVIDTYAIPDGIKSLTDYGNKYTYVDFDNKQFVNNSYTIVLTGNEPMGAYRYGSSEGVTIGAHNQYPYGVGGYGATNVPYVSNEITFAWIARYGQIFWLNALSAYGYTDNWADKANPTNEERNAAVAQLKIDLAKRYADGNPVVLTYQVGEGTTTDISQYLTDYDKYKLIKAQAGGTITFENEHKVAPTSTITYVKAKG